MSTAIQSPPLPSEITAVVIENTCRKQVIDIVGKLVPMADRLNPAQKQMPAIVLASKLGLPANLEAAKGIVPLLSYLLTEAGAGRFKFADICRNLTPIWTFMESGAWERIPDLLEEAAAPAAAAAPEPPPTPAPEPERPAKGRRKAAAADPETPAATPVGADLVIRRRVEVPALPEAKPEPPPAFTPNPADPMSAMAGAILASIRGQIEGIAALHSANAIESIRPTVQALVEEMAKPIVVPGGAGGRSGGGGVDRGAVQQIVTEALGNGASAELAKAVASMAPSALAGVLQKAAESVASQAPKEEEVEELKAASVPAADPTYSWSEELEVVADMIHKASARSPQNALLVGPPGGGKTEFAFQFAARFGKKIMVIDCANMREGRDWFGTKGASNGATWFRKSQFWLAVQAGNCVILMDEFNRASDYIRNPLMPLLDHRRKSYVEEVGETLEAGPGTVFFATMNEDLACSGTHTTDRAMQTRFPRRIELGYLASEMEVQVIMAKVPDLAEEHAKNLVELAGTIRSKQSTFGGTLSQTIGTRQLIAAAEDFAATGPKSLRYTIFNHFNADGGQDSERSQVVKMFELKGYTV